MGNTFSSQTTQTEDQGNSKMMEGEKPILYSYYSSSSSWRVRIGLGLKGIEYEYRSFADVDPEEYKLINPLGQFPALTIHGKTFFQSVAILEYLDETYTQSPLLPKDIATRAKVREIVEIVNSGIQPYSNLAVAMVHSKDESEQIKWIHYWITKGFTALETVLKESAGIYCVGDDVTLADLFLVPQVASAIRWKVEIGQFPIISRIHYTLSQLEAFKKADASNQPDFPNNESKSE